MLLTSVETVPHVVHHMLQFVGISSLLIYHVDRRDTAILLVFIVADHHELANVVV